ncbi:MAG: phosphotransferase family protein [Deltaproteobacteria bacterium]|nr:phosphotransferase family protein [Deltaproteobacteria bacterium]
MSLIDSAKTPREGEELDKARVEEFLKDAIPELSGELSVLQFPSGHSNLTYLLKVGDTDLVLRRPPFGRKAKSAHDMGREYRILSALHPHFPCPKPLAYTEDESILGAPFYVMEKIEGIILRKDLPEGLSLSPPEARDLCGELVGLHAKLHNLDHEKIGLAGFGKPEGYIERQVRGWSRRYRDARTPDAPAAEGVMEWLEKNMPRGGTRAAVIHGDYKFDNVILDPANPLKIIGVLDWEMATIGDPLMDLGSSLAYWVQADDPEEFQAVRMMPTNLPGMMTRDEIVGLYAEKTGISARPFTFYLVFGLFRLMGIAQQIYYRYYHGQTKDKRFEQFIFAVHILEKAAMQEMKKA